MLEWKLVELRRPNWSVISLFLREPWSRKAKIVMESSIAYKFSKADLPGFSYKTVGSYSTPSASQF